MAVPESGLAPGAVPQTIYDGPLAELDPEWDPSGRQLAFATRLVVDGVPQGIGIDVVDVTTGRARTVVRKDAAAGVFTRFPEWSPDGKQIAYVYGVNRVNLRALHVVGADGVGDGPVMVMPEGELIADLVWQTDTRIWVTTRTNAFYWRLRSLDLTTNELTLVDGGGHLGYPQFFHDGTSRMIIEGDEQRNDPPTSYASLYFTDQEFAADGDEKLPLGARLFGEADNQWNPALGPDDDKVAYVKAQAGAPPGQQADAHSVQVVSLEDGEVNVLVGPVVGAGAFYREGLSWQPAGRCVAGFGYSLTAR